MTIDLYQGLTRAHHQGGAIPLAAGTRSIFEITSLGDGGLHLAFAVSTFVTSTTIVYFLVTSLVWLEEKTY